MCASLHQARGIPFNRTVQLELYSTNCQFISINGLLNIRQQTLPTLPSELGGRGYGHENIGDRGFGDDETEYRGHGHLDS